MRLNVHHIPSLRRRETADKDLRFRALEQSPFPTTPARWQPLCKTLESTGEGAMATDELESIRALLASKPRPTGWLERRQRLDEVGSIWPVADDVTLEQIVLGGLPAEWSIAPGSDGS